MANPFLGETAIQSPTHITDPHGDSSGWHDKAPFHVAGLLLLALAVLVLMQVSGFRAVVGIGRG